MSSKGRYANIVIIRCEKGSADAYMNSESTKEHMKQTTLSKGCIFTELKKQHDRECYWYEEFDTKENCDTMMNSQQTGEHIKWCNDNEFYFTALQAVKN